MSNGHTYQFGTIAKLRKIYETHTQEAQTIGERARRQLAEASSHAALAHDAALLLDQTDPEWTAECEAPLVARTLRLRAWREMLDFLEAHPEIGISDYQTVTIEQPNGDRATPEFLDSLKPLGIEVTRSEKYAQADLWFGNHDVKLAAIVKVESPAEIEPVTDPAAIDEHQADAELAAAVNGDAPRPPKGARVRVVKDLVEGNTFTNREGIVYEPYANDGAIAVHLFGTFGDGTIGFAAEELDVVAPIQVGDWVRVHAVVGEAPANYKFPAELEGREGSVTEVRPETFPVEPNGIADGDDGPIGVLLDGETVASGFVVAEVEVLQDAASQPLSAQPA